MTNETEVAAVPFYSGFVSLLGLANAGKSTLLNELIGKKVSAVSPRAQTTRNRIQAVKHGENYQIVFLDTPGLLRKKYQNEMAPFLEKTTGEVSKESNVRVLVVDAEHLRDKEELISLVQQLRSLRMKTPTIVAFNKIDLLRKGDILERLTMIAEVMPHAIIVPVSARNGEGVDRLVAAIVESLPEGPQYFPVETITDQEDAFFIQEMIREKLFFELQEELPYSAAVDVVGIEDDEARKLMTINASIIVERESQKPMVIGKGGERIKAIGVRARNDLERIFGVQVHLALHVRVEENWTKSSKGLKRAGYQY